MFQAAPYIVCLNVYESQMCLRNTFPNILQAGLNLGSVHAEKVGL